MSIASIPSAQKQKGEAAAGRVDGHSVTKHLQTELMQLMMSKNPGISAFPDGDNMLSWLGTIEGAPGTPYEGQTYKLSLKFPSGYPYVAPQVKFETPCFHPNVDKSGAICLDILKENWSAVYNVRTVLLSIQSLLGEPNNDSPLDTVAAGMWSDQEEFTRTVRKKYAEYQASKK